jgi:tetratricopeptide (TPR) repeat protein
MRSTGYALLAALVALCGASEALAADEAAVLRLQAAHLGSEGQCARALPLVRRARAMAPDDAGAALLEGECALNEQHYAEALEPLEDARRLDPELAEATLYLGIAQFHLGHFEQAERELSEAVRLLPERPEAHLYHGLALLETADAARAGSAIEHARSLDPTPVEPAASYFAGRAFQIAGRRAEAEYALQRAIAQAPESEWALEAQRALQNGRERDRPRGAWANLSAGVEYDTNVVLRGSGVVLPTDISGEADVRGAWYASSGVELIRGQRWAMGLLGRYYGSAQLDLTDFDTHFPTAGAYFDRSLGDDTYLRVQPEVGYSWVGFDDYLLFANLTPSLHHNYGEAGTGRAFFRFEYRDYRFPVIIPAVNRDGLNYVGGYEHSISLTETTEFSARLGANYYDSETGEYTYAAPAFGVSARQELPFASALDLDFGYRHEFYENPSFFSLHSKARDDDVYLVSVGLEKRLTEQVKLSARYRYLNNASNVAVYDYDRNVVGAYLSFEFGPTPR